MGRVTSSLRLLALFALLAHASLTVAGVVQAPAWLPILECVAACLLGLRHLREAEADPGRAEIVAGPPPLPARIAGSLDRSSGPSVGS